MMWNLNIVELITTILVWTLILFLANRIYKRQDEKIKLWKIAVVLMIGIFSFSINLPIFHTFISFSILPLGVWLLFIILRNREERWNKYRSFAWLGFWSNYLFLSAALISILLHPLIYPNHMIHTYISKTEDAKIINIHPSASEQLALSENWDELLNELKEGEFFNQTWYDETYMIVDASKRNERFPYLLVNTLPKWGSGLDVSIFIEVDGKGLLVLTSEETMYFRSAKSILEEENR